MFLLIAPRTSLLPWAGMLFDISGYKNTINCSDTDLSLAVCTVSEVH